MSDPQLVQYIKSELDQNTPRDIIEIKLRHIGWPDNLIQEAFSELQTNSVVATIQPNNFYQSKPKKSTALLIATSLIVLILLGSGAAYAYFFIYNSPENHIKKMIEAQNKINSYEFDGTFSYSTENGKPLTDSLNEDSFLQSLQLVDPTLASENSQGFSINTRGKIDAFDKNNPKAALALSGKMMLSGSTFGSKDISAAGQIVYIDKKLFFKIIEFPAMLDQSNQSSFIVNKWILFPPEYLGLATANSNPNALSPFLVGGQPLNLEASLSASLVKNQKKIDQIYIKNKFLLIKTNPDEKINGNDSKHYSLKIDPIKLKEFVKVVLPLIATDMGASADEIKWDSNADKDFEGITQSVKDLDVDLWIGKSDNYLYKLIAAAPILNPNSSEKVNFSTTVSFKDYNVPMNITEPEGAKTVEQLTAEIMQDETPRTDMLKRSRDSARLSDLVTLRKSIDATLAESVSKKLPTCSGGLLVTKCTTLVVPYTDLRSANGRGWIPFDISSYMPILPTDPKNEEEIINSTGNKVKFGYYFRSNGTDYKLATYLEDPSNQTKAEMDGGSLPDMFEVGTDLSSKLGL
jgi:hypothetical protein